MVTKFVRGAVKNHVVAIPSFKSRRDLYCFRRWKMPTSSRFCNSPKLFSPTIKQVKTRSGRVSQSPVRFGQDETMSPYQLRSSCSQYTKLQKESKF